MTNSLVTMADLPEIRTRNREDQIVFVTGVFDVTHPGHILFFEACKRLGDILVVGLGNDAQVALLKPGRPFFPETWRLKIVASFKPVDYCFIGTPETVAHHLRIVELGFAMLRPNVYVVNDDASDIEKRRELAQRFSVEIAIIERSSYPTEFMSLSTTKILEKIRETL